MPLSPAGLGRASVRRLDALLRRRLRVIEFSQDADCILRISLDRAPVARSFADGTRLVQGEPFVILHLWNDRLPQIPAGGPDLAWARTMQRCFVSSLRLLVEYLRTIDPAMAQAKALGGEMGFTTGNDLAAYSRLYRHLGFEVEPKEPANFRERWLGFWQNVYSWLLIWAFNPGSLTGKPFLHLKRGVFLMARGELERRYGGVPRG